MRVRGLSGTVTWMEGEFSIEHTGPARRLGAPQWVQIPEGLIVGIAVQEPDLVRNGMLQIQVAGIDHQQMEPGDAYTILYTRRSAAAFQDLRHQIETMIARRY